MEILHNAITWLLGVIEHFGYPGIAFGMFLESTCFPMPSELIMIPAGFLAQQGKMNIWIAILMGVIGSWLGALLNYYIARALGRPLIIKYGKYFLISQEHFEKGERFFQEHGEIGTFIGRLIPVVRHYISLPAGIARMKMSRFIFYTGLGAGIWSAILAWIGYFAGQSEDLWKPYLKNATLVALIVCVVLVVVYVVLHRRKKAKAVPQD